MQDSDNYYMSVFLLWPDPPISTINRFSRCPWPLFLNRYYGTSAKSLMCPSVSGQYHPLTEGFAKSDREQFDIFDYGKNNEYNRNASYGIYFGAFGRNMKCEPGYSGGDNWQKWPNGVTEAALLSWGARLSNLIFVTDSMPQDGLPEDVRSDTYGGGHSYMVQFGNVFPGHVDSKAYFVTNTRHANKANFLMGDGHVEALAYEQFHPSKTGVSWSRCKTRPYWNVGGTDTEAKLTAYVTYD